MNPEVILAKKKEVSGEIPNDDIEDAVVLSEVIKGKNISTEENIIQVETKDDGQSGRTEVEDFETLEEVEKSFSAARVVFEELSKHSKNLTEIAIGERMIHLFEDNNEQDKNLAKKHKEKYLHHLQLSIDRLRGSMVSDSSEEEIKPQEPLLKQSENVTPQTTEEKLNLTEKVEGEYEIKREEFLKNKSEYQKKQTEFDQKLEEFYKSYDSSYLKKAGRFFGFQPDLPPELINLDVKCRELKKDYVTNLDLSIKNRYGEKHEKKSDAFNIAFSNKFILKPNREFLKKQEVHILSEKQIEKRDRILKILSNNKQSIRIGVIVLAGASGALTGGLSAGISLAAMQGGRMFASIFASTLAGLGVRKAFQGGVDRANLNIENLKKSFSVDDLDNLERELLSAEKAKRGAERTQTIAGVGTAFVVGGIAGYGTHSILNSGGVAESVTTLGGESGDAGRFAGSGSEINIMEGEKDAFSQIGDYGVTETPTAVGESPIESVIEAPEIYTVQKGDTLWEIMEEKYADKLDGLSDVEKNRVLDTLFDKVRDSDEMKASLNLSSENNNIDIIYSGEKIDLSLLGKELERMADIERGDGVLPPYVKQATLPVQSTEGVQKVPINFAKESAELTSAPVQPNPAPEQPLPKVVIAEPSSVSNIPPPPQGLNPNNYFNTPSYREEMIRVFHEEKLFNHMLGKEISKVESKGYDFLSPRSGYTSPYEFFKVMSIEDIEKLSQNPNASYMVQEYGMKYEAFVAWVDKIREMKASGLPSNPGTYLSDLFSRYVVEVRAGRIK